jgi:hypothetical protein
MLRPAALLAAASLLAACSTPGNITMSSERANDPLTGFAYCFSFGCADMYTDLRFTPSEWAEIGQIMEQPTHAADERVQIARAITRIEQILGPRAGTNIDTGGTGFRLTGGPGQLDCYAEAANTTVSLQMMQSAGWLKFHQTGEPMMRGLPYGTMGIEHATGTVTETATGRRWAVDTWFFDNGGPTFVVDLEDWRSGWHPEGGASL